MQKKQTTFTQINTLKVTQNSRTHRSFQRSLPYIVRPAYQTLPSVKIPITPPIPLQVIAAIFCIAAQSNMANLTRKLKQTISKICPLEGRRGCVGCGGLCLVVASL